MKTAEFRNFREAAFQQISQTSRLLVRGRLKGALEAVLFAAPKPLTLHEIRGVTQAKRDDVLAVLDLLMAEYAGRGIQLRSTVEGFTFLTHPNFAVEVRSVTGKKPIRMSRAQLETLAIVAYRQPVTRPEVDEVRGVDSGPVLRTLLDRDMVKVLGKKEEPGRPLLYGTSDMFLDLIGIRSLAELPTLREFTELSDDSRDTYERKLGETAPAGSIVFDDEPDAPIDPTQPMEDVDDKEPKPDEDNDGDGVDDDSVDDDSVDDDSVDDDSVDDDDDSVDDDSVDDDDDSVDDDSVDDDDDSVDDDSVDDDDDSVDDDSVDDDDDSVDDSNVDDSSVDDSLNK